jgi:adenosylhomocysteine nucleosidase
MKTMGVITAIKGEAKYFYAKCSFEKQTLFSRDFYISIENNVRLILVHSHPGPVNSSATAESLIINFSPDFIINTGSAGSHDIQILPGDVVIGNRYTINYNIEDAEQGKIKEKRGSLIRFIKNNEKKSFDSLEPDGYLLGLAQELSSEVCLERIAIHDCYASNTVPRDPRILCAGIGSEEHWTVDAELIEKKKSFFGHHIEDKESSYIAQVCHFHDVPFLSIRGVSDNELLERTVGYEAVYRQIELCSMNAAKLVYKLIEKIGKDF